MSKLLRFADLKARGIVKNWVTLKRWIAHEGFPAGIQLAANSRAWYEHDVEAWLASRRKGGERKGAA
jgi:predicted DNA-binding transcriptional regulator AlpA